MSALIVQGAGGFSVAPSPSAITTRDALLSESAGFTAISNEIDYVAAADLLAEAKRLIRSVENARSEAKAPVLEAGKRIDATAKEFIVKLDAEVTRITNLVLRYREEQHRKAAEAERKAREEAARIERERLAAEAEARRREEAARAEAERKRREAEEADRRAQQTGELALDAAAANAQAEADAAAKAAEQAAAQAAAAAAAPVVVPLVVIPPPPPKIAGLRQREVWVFVVTDAMALATQRPDLVTVTPKTREITAALERGETVPGIQARKEARL